MSEVKRLLDGLGFIESPRWLRGELWFSSFFDGRVYSYSDAAGLKVRVQVEDAPCGIGVFDNGDLSLTLMSEKKVVRVAGEGKTSPFADLAAVTPASLNDLTTSRDVTYVNGVGFALEAWLAEHGPEAALGEPGPPRGSIYVLNAQGHLVQTVGGLRLPNGMAVTPGGDKLIVAETLGMRLSAFEIGPDGRLGDRQDWAALPGMAPDGLCLDASGAAWAADALSGRCVRVAPVSGISETVEVPGVAIACALGGGDGRDLFILGANSAQPSRVVRSKGGAIYHARVETPGVGRP